MTFAASVLATALSMAGVLPIGQPAPESHIKMNNAVDGKSKSVSIADVSGKAGTLVIFTCDHCPFARGWEGRIVELGNAYAKQGIGVMLINANDPSQHEEDGFAGMQARAKSANMQFPYVVDETSNVARAFGATGRRRRSCSTATASWPITAPSTTTSSSPTRCRSTT
jgi:peroxiredoxin